MFSRSRPTTRRRPRFSRLVGGKVVEQFQNWDTFGMMQQLGAIPALAHA
jgi:hypothetical protein